MNNTEEPIIVEQTFDAPTEVVWNAITQIDQMRKWYFENIPAFEPKVGFETQFDVECGGKVFPHKWQVTEVIPHKKLTYNWKYEGYEGDSFVTFELTEETGQTLLRFTQKMVEEFKMCIPEFTRESSVAGWTYFIKESLKGYLDKPLPQKNGI